MKAYLYTIQLDKEEVNGRIHAPSLRSARYLLRIMFKLNRLPDGAEVSQIIGEV
jgi:hypothetical protein